SIPKRAGEPRAISGGRTPGDPRSRPDPDPLPHPVSDPHFFVDHLGPNDERVALSPADSRHALRSLRLRHGEGVTVADGHGAVGRGRLAGADPSSDDGAVIELDEV